ncbi:unnamed protein product [Lactuca virosa]|uniref:F-box domain-containing protein n=1 Tax=Lactuca virosa TaxID=75947 RepID=A0AAU9N9K6_9ASTR|nr:unnamed protein product [Lactuca virosa]
MAHITDLPLHILDVILVAIAISDGARDLARVGAVCNMLLTEAREPVVLKVVNFQRLTFTAIDYMMHHHEKDLLCMSARAGNRAARSIVGKVTILHNFTNCFLSAFIGCSIWANGCVWVEGVNFQSSL